MAELLLNLIKSGVGRESVGWCVFGGFYVSFG